MPDDTFTGKRLHAERLIAAGMHCHIPPSKAAYDEARQLMDRLLDLHRPPVHPWRLFAISCGAVLVFGVLLLLFIPAGVR